MIQSFLKPRDQQGGSGGGGGSSSGGTAGGGAGGGRDGRREGSSSGSKDDAKGFESLVKYCETNTCRHASIATYFGEQGRPVGMGPCRSCDSCTAKGAVERQLQLLRNISGGGRGGRFKVHLGKRIWVEGGDDGAGSDDGDRDPDTFGGFMRPRVAPKAMGFTLASALAKRRKVGQSNDDEDVRNQRKYIVIIDGTVGVAPSSPLWRGSERLTSARSAGLSGLSQFMLTSACIPMMHACNTEV